MTTRFAERARWVSSKVNGHAVSRLIMRFRGSNTTHELGVVWPANEDGTRWFVSLLCRDAICTRPTKRKAQALVRKELLTLQNQLQSLY